MTDDKTRAEFEELIKSSPFEHMCDRNGDNSAWPGHYKRYETQLAWDVWQAAKERYGQKWISVFDDYPENPKNGDKILGWNGYAFECEYDDGYWGNIGGEEFTYWMPLLEPPATKEQKHEQ